ncbi:protein geranylgeranyltransferase type II, alpha subunit, putative [Plasmodium ovale curtisi]|uniref:Protein farnesyltransferase/geranylgeranyltransferase type-1 subunit alpha n=1 Tax=Plasmodium ovale curtisi TaxID=864141 RepID=A0A1A8X024_PLAOA|nr:protein geranylgeranyltransferase type II, alpha subunit, putative [Plasmodium ovale curtisi]
MERKSLNAYLKKYNLSYPETMDGLNFHLLSNPLFKSMSKKNFIIDVINDMDRERKKHKRDVAFEGEEDNQDDNNKEESEKNIDGRERINILNTYYSDNENFLYSLLASFIENKIYSFEGYIVSSLVIKINSSYYSAWIYRRRCLRKLNLNFLNDLKFTRFIINDNIKSFQSWFHRRWLVEYIYKVNIKGSGINCTFRQSKCTHDGEFANGDDVSVIAHVENIRCGDLDADDMPSGKCEAGVQEDPRDDAPHSVDSRDDAPHCVDSRDAALHSVDSRDDTPHSVDSHDGETRSDDIFDDDRNFLSSAEENSSTSSDLNGLERGCSWKNPLEDGFISNCEESDFEIKRKKKNVVFYEDLKSIIDSCSFFKNALKENEKINIDEFLYEEFLYNNCDIFIDTKNYNSWAHKTWLVDKFSLMKNEYLCTKYNILLHEFIYINFFLKCDIYNNSVWVYRYFIFNKLNYFKEKNILKREIMFCLNYTKEFYDNEAIFNYFIHILFTYIDLCKKEKNENKIDIFELPIIKKVKNELTEFQEKSKSVLLFLSKLYSYSGSHYEEIQCYKCLEKNDHFNDIVWKGKIEEIERC